MDGRLQLMGHDAATSIGKTGYLIGLEKPFSKLIENAAKWKESTSTHGKGNVPGFKD